jgi:hypothetical protein
VPVMSLVTLPMWKKLPFGSIVSNEIWTPVAFEGIGLCWNMCSIHASMNASDIAGVPLSVKSKLPATLLLPEEVWSVTVPVIMTLDPNVGTICGAETVVALGPLPKQ